jgi:hypothetical protein
MCTFAGSLEYLFVQAWLWKMFVILMCYAHFRATPTLYAYQGILFYYSNEKTQEFLVAHPIVCCDFRIQYPFSNLG